MSSPDNERMVNLAGRPLLTSDISSAADWITDFYSKPTTPVSRFNRVDGKFVAINELVIFAPAEAQHIDVYAQTMLEESLFRQEVLEQVALIRQKGLATLRSSFVTDAGYFSARPIGYDDEPTAVVELRDESMYFDRASVEGRQKTVEHVKQGVAMAGLLGIDIRTIL